MDNVLDLEDRDTSRWLNSQLPRLHVVLGDSVARDSGIASKQPEDRVLNLARGGATWGSLHDRLEETMAEWRRSAKEEERQPGTAIIWMTGNDAYNRATGLPSISETKLEAVADHAQKVTEVVMREAGVVVLGPIARLSGEVLPTKWESTSAYALERRLIHTLPRGAVFVLVGRQLTKKLRRRPHCVSDCLQWYKRDGVHLNTAGYQKVAKMDRLPEWIEFCVGRQ